jgi:Protein of unknown function (DUF2817)
MMSSGVDYFPPDYQTARSWFREAATGLGWHLDVQAIAGNEALTIDAAISPATDAERVLLISSGLHGVEGPAGTAIQLAAMERWAKNGGPPDGVRVVLLHALNPQGYALGRRTDAANIDPNRNFLLPGQEFSGSPDGYKQFNSLLNPKRPPAYFNTFIPRAWFSLLRYGLPALKQALVAGQYDYPQGVFFGGHGPCATQLALRDRLPDWVGQASSVVHLDVHTGLGRWGSFKLLLDAPVTTEQLVRMDRWFGPENYEKDDPNGVAYLPRGSFGPWCQAQGITQDYLYAVAEFATYGHVKMLGGLRQENRAHHWGQPGNANTERAKALLKELFCPVDPGWRKHVLDQGLRIVEQAATGLGSLAFLGMTNSQ